MANSLNNTKKGKIPEQKRVLLIEHVVKALQEVIPFMETLPTEIKEAKDASDID